MLKRMIAVAATLALTAAMAAAESYTIGIGQFAEHGSLDNCRTGFIEGLAEAGLVEGDNLTVIYQNAQADMGVAQQIAAQFAAKPVDLMVGIATPMAQAVSPMRLGTMGMSRAPSAQMKSRVSAARRGVTFGSLPMPPPRTSTAGSSVLMSWPR